MYSRRSFLKTGASVAAASLFPSARVDTAGIEPVLCTIA
jgi:hypothetical protein